MGCPGRVLGTLAQASNLSHAWCISEGSRDWLRITRKEFLKMLRVTKSHRDVKYSIGNLVNNIVIAM